MGQSGVTDAANRRMVVFGGDTTTFTNLTSELWALRLGGPEAWTLLAPAGAVPAPRIAHTAVYDSVFHRMVLYGGWDGFVTSFNDVWIIDL